jgi:hypothetical protein
MAFSVWRNSECDKTEVLQMPKNAKAQFIAALLTVGFFVWAWSPAAAAVRIEDRGFRWRGAQFLNGIALSGKGSRRMAGLFRR